MLPSLARFSQSMQSRSSWLIAVRSTLQPYGCQEELSTWLEEEFFIWPRHVVSIQLAKFQSSDSLL
jgi:hypothetical protein